jgi:regulatory protein YycI of two-component signal transduction system YycFG
MFNILEVVTGLFVFALVLTPIVLSVIILIKLPTRSREPRVSPEHIAQLEQNDNIIVEDINNALTEIVTRLEAIEERLDREDQTVKGFAKKGKQQLND